MGASNFEISLKMEKLGAEIAAAAAVQRSHAEHTHFEGMAEQALLGFIGCVFVKSTLLNMKVCDFLGNPSEELSLQY